MSRKTNQFGHVMAGVVFGLLSAMPALADDTEIYLGQNLGVTDVRPNILFLIDTSGSMGTNVTSTQGTYDPAVTYPGCFDVNRVYYSSTLSCSTSSYFNLSNQKCDAATTAFATAGFYNGRLAQWRSLSGNYRWRTISVSNRDVECQDDNGVHGSGAGPVWASNTNGPWSSNSAQSVAWGSTGQQQTIYSGNYKNWAVDNTFTQTRLKIVQDTVAGLANSLNNVNVGLMRFNTGGNGGVVVNAMESLATNKTDFLNALNALTPNGATPLSQALYESAVYYRGGLVDYGNGYTPTSVAESRTPATASGANYNSPIDFQCQKNFVVFLTDGEPNPSDVLTATRATRMGGIDSCSTQYLDRNYDMTYNCLPQIAASMAGKDQSTEFADTQRVSTYTIGFTTTQTLLKDAADASRALSGQGEYHTASDSVTLIDAFNNIITDILSVSSTFSSPAVSVNAFNRSTHRSDMYFSLFKPQTGPHWDGNYKRYRLAFNASGDPMIVDVNSAPAVDATSGYFLDNSTSYWTPAAYAPDGKEAPKGGAASRLTNTRNVYTYTGTNTDLSHASNLLHETNGAVTDVMLGVTATERDNLIKWARGIDVDDMDVDGDTTDARLVMGDPLHSEPAMIQYGGPDSDPDITAYVATNDGYLHAFNTQIGAGTEHFAFVPRELLPNLNVHYQDSNATTKTYGLDGSITAWVNDGKDGSIDGGASGDFAYLYFGMRRGGNNYYAMDVTNRNNPRLMWTITGGTGDFAELGQSWSQPALRKIRMNGADRYVLIFAGGYDTNQDTVSTRSTDGIGRAVYIVDAKTGARLWWAADSTSADLNLNTMDYSIPSSVASADVNGDGYTDLLYVGDMGGQIFRFDIKKGEGAETLANLITGGRIADLAGNTITENRRFYYPPSVALMKSDSGNYYLSLAIASGYREHPLNTDIDDRIYMIKDTPVKGAPGTYITVTESDLFDTTDNLVREGSAGQQQTARDAIDAAGGWYIRLESNGEKGLAKGLIFGGSIYITTYIPTDTTLVGQSCAPSEGSGRLYVISVEDGGPAEGTTKDERTNVLYKPGIPADPKMIRTSDPDQDEWAVCVGTECGKAESLGKHESLYYYER